MVKTRSKISSSSSFYSENAPQFFKVYLPQHCSQRLRIPQAFNKYLKIVIPFKSILRSHAYNKSWCVHVKKMKDHFVFDQGWPAFVKDNYLEREDFLIFSYNGNSEFHVTVFGQNHCQKEFPITLKSDKSLPFKGKPIMCQDNEDQITRRLRSSMQIQEKVGAGETPCNFDTENPFFENDIRPTHAQRGYMHIPLNFVTRHMRKHTPTAMLKHANNSWKVNLKRRKTTLVLSGGLRKFMVDNALKEGDSLGFELIQTDGYIFNVSILRAKSEETKGANRILRGIKMGYPRELKVGAIENSCKSISKHPFFEIVLPPSYVDRDFMTVPSSFWHSYMDKATKMAMLEYSSKLWPIKLSCKGRQLYFSDGWCKFVKENNLQVGNICCFDLIERENHVFKFNVSVCGR